MSFLPNAAGWKNPGITTGMRWIRESRALFHALRGRLLLVSGLVLAVLVCGCSGLRGGSAGGRGNAESFGNTEVNKGDLVWANADYTKAIEPNPYAAVAYVNRGNARQASGDVDAALDDFNMAIGLNPNSALAALAYYDRGNARRAKGDVDGAMADWNKAIELSPEIPDAYVNRGVARRAKGDVEGAIADYTRAIELNPNSSLAALAYYDRGNARRAKGDVDGAVADWDKAVELNPALGGIKQP